MKKLLKNPQVVLGVIVVSAFIFIAVFAPVLAPNDPVDTDVRARFFSPFYHEDFPLGTDDLGRCVLSRLMFGARVSLIVGILSTLIGGIVGVILGLFSGYYGGKLDTVVMRFIDIMLAFPGILLALVIVTIIGTGTASIIIAVSIFAIPTFARISRGSTLSTKKLEYVDAIKAVGATDFRVMFKHILPNILTPIVVQATIFVATAIVATATLSFLGVGVQPPTPEWGNMLSGATQNLERAPYLLYLPGLAIFILVLSINLIGDGLRNALETKK